MFATLFQKHIAMPLIALLKQGLSPQKLAISVACGIVIGIFPILGTTTVLCILAGTVFRLNHAAMQLMNYLMAPLQIALFLPFVRVGEFLTNARRIPFSVGEILAMLQADLWGSILQLWQTSLHAILAWTLAAPAMIGVVFYALKPVFKRMARRIQTGAEA